MIVVILGVFRKAAPDVRTTITHFQHTFFDTIIDDPFDIELWINRGQDVVKKKVNGRPTHFSS